MCIPLSLTLPQIRSPYNASMPSSTLSSSVAKEVCLSGASELGIAVMGCETPQVAVLGYSVGLLAVCCVLSSRAPVMLGSFSSLGL